MIFVILPKVILIEIRFICINYIVIQNNPD